MTREVHLLEADGELYALVRAPEPLALEMLSAAERDVVRLAASGLSNAAIAKRRGTSRATVGNQLGAAYEKLGISGRRALASRARTAPEMGLARGRAKRA